MSQSGSFGVNYKKSYGTDPAMMPANVGDMGSCPDGAFVFVQANGAIAQYAWVTVASDGQAAELTTTTAGSNNLMIGVAQVALADNEYAWVWVGGNRGGGSGKGIKGKVAASYVALSNLQTTATAGVADDASTKTINYVVGLTSTTPAAAVELLSTAVIKVN